MNTYQINNLAEDFEKKLSLYSQQNYIVRENNFFNIDRYAQYVNIIINPNDFGIQSMINELEDYYQSGIYFENDKLNFGYSDINMIASKLYKELWNQDKSNTLAAYINIIKNRIDGDLSEWFYISFDDEIIKSHFLDSATDYIITHQNTEWIEAFNRIDYQRYSWLRKINDSDIPIIFENLNDLYLWFKKNKLEECLEFIGDSIVNSLLDNLIEKEIFSTHYVGENRIVKILGACKNDYKICGGILTSEHIKLNCFLLTQFEYSLFAFLNLFDIHSQPNRSDDSIDYTKVWNEMLSNQLVNIFFKHFHSLHNKNEFSQIIFILLNYLADQYTLQYNNPNYYKGNYVLTLVLEKLTTFKLSVSQYENISLFNFCIEKLIALQLDELKNQKIFDSSNYFLLSYYLKQIEIEKRIIDKDYSNLIANMTQAIINSLSAVINDNAQSYIDYQFIDKIDFGLLYKLSLDHSAWLVLLKIDALTKEWKTILEERKEKRNFSSTDPREPKDKIELYFQILLMIFDKTEDQEVAKIINMLAITFGLGFEFGIFFDFHINPKKLYDEYVEKLNLFDDGLFNTFLAELSKQKRLKSLLQLLSQTISKSRRTNIEVEVKQIANSLDDNNMSYSDMRESILYAVYNDFRHLASTLIDTYQVKIANTNYKNFKKEFDEVVCKKELLDIYYSNDEKDEKFKKLNMYKIEFDDKNWGERSKQTLCENYRDFVRALIFFEDEAQKTYQILTSLLDKEVNSLYLINMVSAYLKIYENDVYKKEKYTYILNEYKKYEQKLHNHKKSLFEYQTLLYALVTIENEKEFTHLWQEMPNQYQYDIRILELRCEFLQQNKQLAEAEAYIHEIKRISVFTQNEEEKIIKIEEDLNANIKIETEYESNVKLDILPSDTLTPEKARNYWLEIKEMPEEDHAFIFAKKQNINDYIIQIMLDLSEELLDRKINIAQNHTNMGLEHENIINDWTTSLLQQKMSFIQWKIKDQTRGGCSESGKSPGEKDILIKNAKGNDIFLFEAFRLMSNNSVPKKDLGKTEKNYIKDHIDKLDCYNATGCQSIVVMVYVKNYALGEMVKEYADYLKTWDYKGFDEQIKSKNYSIDEIYCQRTKIKILKDIRYINGREVNIYHFLLDFS